MLEFDSTLNCLYQWILNSATRKNYVSSTFKSLIQITQCAFHQIYDKHLIKRKLTAATRRQFSALKLSSIFKYNKYERYYWTRKTSACLLTLLCHYGQSCLCINMHHYAPPTGCSVTHRAATSLAAAGPWDVSEGAMSF